MRAAHRRTPRRASAPLSKPCCQIFPCSVFSGVHLLSRAISHRTKAAQSLRSSFDSVRHVGGARLAMKHFSCSARRSRTSASTSGSRDRAARNDSTFLLAYGNSVLNTKSIGVVVPSISSKHDTDVFPLRARHELLRCRLRRSCMGYSEAPSTPAHSRDRCRCWCRCGVHPAVS